MCFQCRKITNESILEEDQRHGFCLVHFLETVEVFKTMFTLQSVNFENFSINPAADHLISDIFKLVVKTVDDDQASILGIVFVRLYNLFDSMFIEWVANSFLSLDRCLLPEYLPMLLTNALLVFVFHL